MDNLEFNLEDILMEFSEESYISRIEMYDNNSISSSDSITDSLNSSFLDKDIENIKNISEKNIDITDDLVNDDLILQIINEVNGVIPVKDDDIKDNIVTDSEDVKIYNPEAKNKDESDYIKPEVTEGNKLKHEINSNSKAKLKRSLNVSKIFNVKAEDDKDVKIKENNIQKLKSRVTDEDIIESKLIKPPVEAPDLDIDDSILTAVTAPERAEELLNQQIDSDYNSSIRNHIPNIDESELSVTKTDNENKEINEISEMRSALESAIEDVQISIDELENNDITSDDKNIIFDENSLISEKTSKNDTTLSDSKEIINETRETFSFPISEKNEEADNTQENHVEFNIDSTVEPYAPVEFKENISFTEVDDDSEIDNNIFNENDHKRRIGVKAYINLIKEKLNSNKDGKKSSSKKNKSVFMKQLSIIGLKLQQRSENTKTAPADAAEDLGQEMDAERASKYYGSHTKFIKQRLSVATIFCIFAAYISFGFPVPGAINDVAVSSILSLIFLMTITVICLDQFTAGVMDLVRKKVSANALISISCIVSAIDAVVIFATGNTDIGLPYCAISGITLTFALWASLLLCRGNRFSLRAVSLIKKPNVVTAENNIGEYEDSTLISTKTDTEGFVRRTEESAYDEQIYDLLAPWILIASLILGLISAALSSSWINFAHIVSAILIPTAPFGLFLSYSLPYSITSRKLFHSGTAISGWSGISDIGESKHIIVKDSDIFPRNTIEIESIRVLEGISPQKIITYAGSLIIASGSALSPAFTELLNKNACVIENVDEFKCHEGGGLTAMVNGDEVLCGNASFMHLMGIRIPQKMASKSSVFVAVNGMISAIFTIKYTPVLSVQKSLVTLMRSGRTSIFAIKDFNITPEMIRHKFKMPSDKFDFPSFAERYQISNAVRSDNSKPAAVMAKSGMAAMVQLSEEGHRLFNIVRINVLLSVLFTILGMLILFILCASNAFDSIAVGNMLLYMTIWLLTQIFIVIIQNK